MLSRMELSEVLLIDITASRTGKIDEFLLKALRRIADFPISYAGGIRSLKGIDKLFRVGIDKVIISACNSDICKFVDYTSTKYGIQSIGLSMDYIYNAQSLVVFNPYTRSSSNKLIREILEYIPVDKISDIILTNVGRVGSCIGLDYGVLTNKFIQELKNPIILSGGFSVDKHNLSRSLVRNLDCEGIASSASIFLQSECSHSALVSLARVDK